MPEQAPDGSIIITPKEFYDGVRRDIDEIKTAVVGLPRRVDKLENEVTALKARMLFFAGFAAALGTGAGTVLTKVLGG